MNPDMGPGSSSDPDRHHHDPRWQPATHLILFLTTFTFSDLSNVHRKWTIVGFSFQYHTLHLLTIIVHVCSVLQGMAKAYVFSLKPRTDCPSLHVGLFALLSLPYPAFFIIKNRSFSLKIHPQNSFPSLYLYFPNLFSSPEPLLCLIFRKRADLQETILKQYKIRYNKTRKRPHNKTWEVNPIEGKVSQEYAKASEKKYLFPLLQVPQNHQGKRSNTQRGPGADPSRPLTCHFSLCEPKWALLSLLDGYKIFSLYAPSPLTPTLPYSFHSTSQLPRGGIWWRPPI